MALKETAIAPLLAMAGAVTIVANPQTGSGFVILNLILNWTQMVRCKRTFPARFCYRATSEDQQHMHHAR